MGPRLERMLKRRIWRDLLDLRRAHRDVTADEFERLAREHIESEYEGISPENLKLILQFLIEILPIIIALF